jgi:hypothetical protein
MVQYGMSLAMGDPQGDEFMAAVSQFAIYNSIVGVVVVAVTYVATVLMNITAYNQVNIYRTKQSNVFMLRTQYYLYMSTCGT